MDYYVPSGRGKDSGADPAEQPNEGGADRGITRALQLHNNEGRITSAAYALIRSADALLSAQDITVKVVDSALTDYKVTLGFYNKDGIYTGRSGILPVTDGVLTISASEMRGTHFRVNVCRPGELADFTGYRNHD